MAQVSVAVGQGAVSEFKPRSGIRSLAENKFRVRTAMTMVVSARRKKIVRSYRMVLERSKLAMMTDWVMDGARSEEELDEAEDTALELVKYVLVGRTMALSRHLAEKEAEARAKAEAEAKAQAHVKKEHAVHVPRYERNAMEAASALRAGPGPLRHLADRVKARYTVAFLEYAAFFANDLGRRLLHTLLAIEDKEAITQLDARDDYNDADEEEEEDV